MSPAAQRVRAALPLHPFGRRSGLDVPRVNMGGMRLPADLDEAVSLLRYAIDSGLRYIDCSRGYGECEWVVGRALKGGYRRKVILSTKWAPWITKIQPADNPSADRVRHRIDESMRRLDVDYLDFYQIWNITHRNEYDAAVARGGFLDGVLKAKKEGLVRHIGFTAHAPAADLLEYIDEADWCEVLLVSYNMLNQSYAPALEAAHRKGIGTLVMNPVGGGRLAEASPALLKLAREVGAKSVADLAVRYVLSNPNVDTILCGLHKRSDVDETLKSAARKPFTPAQKTRIDGFLADLLRAKSGFCTACKYCMPCPQGIDIPAVMSLIYDDRCWGFRDFARARYAGLRTAKADACVQCGKCEKACTQHLKIIQEMRYAHRNLRAAKKAAGH